VFDVELDLATAGQATILAIYRFGDGSDQANLAIARYCDVLALRLPGFRRALIVASAAGNEELTELRPLALAAETPGQLHEVIRLYAERRAVRARNARIRAIRREAARRAAGRTPAEHATQLAKHVVAAAGRRSCGGGYRATADAGLDCGGALSERAPHRGIATTTIGPVREPGF
jgi:hypothetical protein